MLLAKLIGPAFDDVIKSRLTSWGINSATEIQTLSVQAGVASGVSMIVCAPTSSGKTLVGEIATLSAIRDKKRILYLVSHKALADQKFADLQKRLGEGATEPIASISISTGDRDEGSLNADITVATYEKALGLLLSGDISPAQSIVIADELQIIGDPTRGATIETLCTILRQRSVSQLIGLTATIENPREIADWFGCKLVLSTKRDVPLHQEIWYERERESLTFGSTTPTRQPLDISGDAIDVVRELLNAGRGPVLVFTESRNEAMRYANAYAPTRQCGTKGVELAQQLELFSEATETSTTLCKNAERGVTFHTADLSPQERTVLEDGFLAGKFDVCFATSTLSAGVNFPFKSVVFPKLTYQWGDRAGTRIPRSEYRNMSGRAGRLNMHSEGHVILLPRNGVELAHARSLVQPVNDIVTSQLVSLSMRRTLLTLLASGAVSDENSIATFFESTLYWHQAKRISDQKTATILSRAKEAVVWLLQNGFIEEQSSTLIPTTLGRSCASSGLLPGTVLAFTNLYKSHSVLLEGEFTNTITGIVYWLLSCDEFSSNTPTRFLPFVQNGVAPSATYLQRQTLFCRIDHSDDRLNKCAHALVLFVGGIDARQINHETGVSTGNLYRLAADVAWIIQGLHRVSCGAWLGCSQKFSNQLSLLGRRMLWGAPAEALDVIRVAERHSVPGFGRTRALTLFGSGLTTFDQIWNAGVEKLKSLLKSEKRAASLLEAIAKSIGFGDNRLKATHQSVAKYLGIEEIVANCEAAFGVDYDKAVMQILKKIDGLSVTLLDDGIRPNVPDLLIVGYGVEILLECKTCTKTPPLIKKEEAFAVLQKAVDYEKAIHRVTLGKPYYDEHSKTKVLGAIDITLVEHAAFMEGILRVLTGRTKPSDFIQWLTVPGLAEIDRLTGDPTYRHPLQNQRQKLP